MAERHRKTIAALALTAAAAFGPSVSAMPILSGVDMGGGLWGTGAPDADGRTATAQFVDMSTSSINMFSIVLSNGAASQRQPNEMLVGIFFEFGTDPGIIDPSFDALGMNVTGNVVAGARSLLQTFGADYGSNLDGEYAFRDGMNALNGGLGNYAISAAAYDPLGINPVINSAVAYHPASTNGAEFGIAAGGTTGPLPGVRFWVDGSATIYFQTTGAFNFANLTQVNFLYGTSFEPATAVPEPGTLSLLGAGLIVLGFASRRRKKA